MQQCINSKCFLIENIKFFLQYKACKDKITTERIATVFSCDKYIKANQNADDIEKSLFDPFYTDDSCTDLTKDNIPYFKHLWEKGGVQLLKKLSLYDIQFFKNKFTDRRWIQQVFSYFSSNGRFNELFPTFSVVIDPLSVAFVDENDPCIALIDRIYHQEDSSAQIKNFINQIPLFSSLLMIQKYYRRSIAENILRNFKLEHTSLVVQRFIRRHIAQENLNDNVIQRSVLIIIQKYIRQFNANHTLKIRGLQKDFYLQMKYIILPLFLKTQIKNTSAKVIQKYIRTNLAQKFLDKLREDKLRENLDSLSEIADAIYHQKRRKKLFMYGIHSIAATCFVYCLSKVLRCCKRFSV